MTNDPGTIDVSALSRAQLEELAKGYRAAISGVASLAVHLSAISHGHGGGSDPGMRGSEAISALLSMIVERVEKQEERVFGLSLLLDAASMQALYSGRASAH